MRYLMSYAVFLSLRPAKMRHHEKNITDNCFPSVVAGRLFDLLAGAD